jgi:hypothetical protein
MNSSENSLHQFERIEMEVADTSKTGRAPSNRNNKNNESVLAGLKQLQQQRLQLMLNDHQEEASHGSNRQEAPATFLNSSGDRSRSNTPFSGMLGPGLFSFKKGYCFHSYS